MMRITIIFSLPVSLPKGLGSSYCIYVKCTGKLGTGLLKNEYCLWPMGKAMDSEDLDNLAVFS
jgi:hypothetical protein